MHQLKVFLILSLVAIAALAEPQLNPLGEYPMGFGKRTPKMNGFHLGFGKRATPMKNFHLGFGKRSYDENRVYAAFGKRAAVGKGYELPAGDYYDSMNYMTGLGK
jgi:hypothetical protein